MALFAEDPTRRERASGLALDMVGGNMPLKEGLDAALERHESTFF